MAVVTLAALVVEPDDAHGGISAFKAAIAIVSAFLPLAFGLRHTWLYRKLVFVGGSLLIALVASTWLAERVFNFKLLPF